MRTLFTIAVVAAFFTGWLLAQAGLINTVGALLLIAGAMTGIVLLYRSVKL